MWIVKRLASDSVRWQEDKNAVQQQLLVISNNKIVGAEELLYTGNEKQLNQRREKLLQGPQVFIASGFILRSFDARSFCLEDVLTQKARRFKMSQVKKSRSG